VRSSRPWTPGKCRRTPGVRKSRFVTRGSCGAVCG